MKKPSIYRLVGVPYLFFGETHVFISVWHEGTILKAEYSVLSKRPHERLDQGVIDVETADYPAELPAVDEAAMEAEALQQAKIDLILELEKRALAANREDLAYQPIELVQDSMSPMAVWARKAYPTKFADLANSTKSPDLKAYLNLVMRMSRLQATGR